MCETIRINKYLAQCGAGSRRRCDEIILAQKVFINGEAALIGSQVNEEKDTVTIDGKEVFPISQKRYFAYHKPKGVIVSRSDENGRATIYDALKKLKISNCENLKYVGRLDFNSEGLLLLTNDGDLAFALTHPKFCIKKVYFVKTDRELLDDEIRKVIGRGVEENGEILKADALRFKYRDSESFCYEVDLHEGKNRQVRRIFEALGATVLQLKRLQFASVKLGNLDYGKIRELPQKEIERLKGVQNSPNGV
ncbi:MAG: rRNA pseudouridine synthase [Chitinispirillales bacterium]|jgi:pseudouridine synthase|nr:rRNA pseudouridine synthase [Chitinispirillales bacterium]